jgi:hypothetical protein
MRKQVTIVWISFALLFANCKQQDVIVVNVQSSSFVRDIPLMLSGRNKGQVDYNYTHCNSDANALGLDFIKNGYDSLQIRVWLGQGMARISHLVIIKYNASGYFGEIWEYENVAFFMPKDGYLVSRDSIKVLSVRKIPPKSGWINLFKKVTELDIVNLKHSGDIAGYSRNGADGMSCYFEVATRKFYRFFYFDMPEDQSKNIREAKDVVTFSNYLEKEFGFNFTH